MAERFAATAELDKPKSPSIRCGKWLPTFLGYPELRRQLEAGRTQQPAPVTLLAIDARSFKDAFVDAARSDAVVRSLAAHPAVESGMEVEFESYPNATCKPLPPMHVPRLMDVIEACLMPVDMPPAPLKTAWVVRRSDAQIARIKQHPMIVQRASRCSITLPPRGVEVRVLALAIALGFEPFTPENISITFINDYEPVWHGLLENLAAQDRTPIQVVGDSQPTDFLTEGENTLRAFAEETLALVSSPCTRADFAGCVEVFKQQYPTALSVWDRLGKSP